MAIALFSGIGDRAPQGPLETQYRRHGKWGGNIEEKLKHKPKWTICKDNGQAKVLMLMIHMFARRIYMQAKVRHEPICTIVINNDKKNLRQKE